MTAEPYPTQLPAPMPRVTDESVLSRMLILPGADSIMATAMGP